MLFMDYGTTVSASVSPSSLKRTHSADVKSSGLSLLLVAAGQDQPGSSLCQIQSRGLADASVAP